MTNNDGLSQNTPANTTPGVQSHMPGEDSPDGTAAGVVHDGTAPDTVTDSLLPAEDGPSGGGDSLADDETIPGTDESADEGAADDSVDDGVTDGHA